MYFIFRAKAVFLLALQHNLLVERKNQFQLSQWEGFLDSAYFEYFIERLQKNLIATQEQVYYYFQLVRIELKYFTIPRDAPRIQAFIQEKVEERDFKLMKDSYRYVLG